MHKASLNRPFMQVRSERTWELVPSPHGLSANLRVLSSFPSSFSVVKGGGLVYRQTALAELFARVARLEKATPPPR
jgi:hypothetical protein